MTRPHLFAPAGEVGTVTPRAIGDSIERAVNAAHRQPERGAVTFDPNVDCRERFVAMSWADDRPRKPPAVVETPSDPDLNRWLDDGGRYVEPFGGEG